MNQFKYIQQIATDAHYHTENNTKKNASEFRPLEKESVSPLRHVCRVCNKSFKAKSLLDIHMRVHVGAKPFACPLCKHRASQKGNLKLHMKKHHGQDLPVHIDLVPDSGIWGNFPGEGYGESDEGYVANMKIPAPRSSLINEDIVDVIKTCQNEEGKSTMGRTTKNLHDFLEVAQEKLQTDNASAQKKEIHVKSNKKLSNIDIKKTDIKSLSQFSQEAKKNTSNCHSNEYFFCNVCNWKTFNLDYLKLHMKTHKIESHQCKICGKKFKEAWYLKSHLKSHINSQTSKPLKTFPQKNITLGVPKDTYSSQAEENDVHEKNDKKANYQMCLKCGLIFSKKILKIHIDVCGKTQSCIDDCLNCNSKIQKDGFMASLRLSVPAPSSDQANHLNSFDTMVGSYLVCLSNCRKSTSNPTNAPDDDPFQSLKNEIKNSIAVNGINATKKSFKELIKDPDFKVLLSHENIENINHLFRESEICNQNKLCLNVMNMSTKRKLQDPSESNLKRGTTMQSHSCKEQPVKKQISHNMVRTGNTMESSSKGQGYQCKYCYKWFKYRSVLGMHVRTHTGERPYKCPYCVYAGTQQNCLKLHIQRHHPQALVPKNRKTVIRKKGPDPQMKEDGKLDQLSLEDPSKIEPAQCPICHRMSPSPSYLKVHMRSHQQTVDHVCKVCGHTFKELWNLNNHLCAHKIEMNKPFVARDTQNCEMKTDSYPKLVGKDAASNAYTPLMKQQSLPYEKSEISVRERNYLSRTSSWSPLDTHEDFKGINHNIAPSSETSESCLVRPYISKRKAFQPSRHMPEQHTQQEPVRSRKSKPRKLCNGKYLTSHVASVSSDTKSTCLKEGGRSEELS